MRGLFRAVTTQQEPPLNILNQKTEQVAPDRLLPHPRNPNVGRTDVIQASIEELGFYGAIVAQQSTRHILVGHHRHQAAVQAGAEKVPVIWVDVSDAVALKILLVDNRTAELGQRDEEAVAALLQEMLDSGDGLIGTGYDTDDLDQLLASLQGDVLPPVDDDEPASASELEVAQEKWAVQPGDIWEISSLSTPGRSHRVLCGDGLAPGAFDQLLQGDSPDVIHCDPPYGISIVNTGGQIGSGQVYRPVIGDDSTDTAVRAYQLTSERFPKAVHVWWGGNYYADHLPPSMGWLVWDKQNDGLSFADVELAWTNQHRAARMFRHLWSGGARGSETDERRIHPTQKPIALGVWVLEQLAAPGSIVLDLFLGSGMSLLAAEQHGSVCFAAEIEPLYVAGVLERAARRGLSCTRQTPVKFR